MLFIYIYIAGFVATYLSLRICELVKGKGKDWTLQDRVVGILLGLLSWIGFLSTLIIWVTYDWDADDMNKPVKW